MEIREQRRKCSAQQPLKPASRSARQAFAFRNRDHLVRLYIGEFIDNSAGPVYLEISLCGRFQAEVNAQVALRDVTPPAAHFVHLPVLALGCAVNTRADTRSVRLGSARLHLEPVVL